MKLVMIIAKIIQPATLLMEYALTVVKMDILEHTVTNVRHISFMFWYFLHWSIHLLIMNSNKRFLLFQLAQKVITVKTVPFSVLQIVKHVTRMDCALVRKGGWVQIALKVITYNDNVLHWLYYTKLTNCDQIYKCSLFISYPIL